MKLKAQTVGSEQDVALTLNDSSVSAEVDGRRHELEVRPLSGGTYLLIEGPEVYSCRVERSPGIKEKLIVTVRGVDHEINLIDPKRLRSGALTGAHDHGSAEIISPMPGKVVRVLVEIGSEVEAGAGVIVVEAMKMQNELKSPRAGKIAAINAQAGATVNAGDVLVVIE